MTFNCISIWTWCYALWSSIAIPHDLDATLYDLHWHFHMNLMLRSMIFNCNSTHPHPIAWGGVGWDNNVIGISTWTWCYALWSSLAFPHEPDATLYDLQLQFHTSASDSLGWGGIITSLAFPHEPDATLYDLQLHFHMNLMLRSMIFNCNSTWSWCYALWSSLAFPHEPDATLYDFQLQFHMLLMLRSMIFNWHFHMILMLRSMIFKCNSTWSWCYALWSSIAIPHDLDATLYGLHWHFHMNLMLRSMIFNCNSTHPHPIAWGGWDNNVIGISTWSWCYALWSSLAIPHGLDAALYDLHCHFHMNLMLRSMIFIGISTWTWCYALWSSLAFPHEPDATLYDLHWHFHMN